jgi:proteic killer suppression protein
MVESIKHKGLKLFFEKGDSSKINQTHRKRLQLILSLLHAAVQVSDLNFPGSNLHPLKGERQDFWSINVSGNWRIIFRFENGNVYDVDYLDYH